MERSTERLTTTGTNSSHLLQAGQGERMGPSSAAGYTPQGPRALPFLSVPRENPAGGLCDWESPPPSPGGPRGSVLRKGT